MLGAPNPIAPEKLFLVLESPLAVVTRDFPTRPWLRLCELLG